jgi:hypothetical protein
VEPSYLDAWNTTPAAHYRSGKVHTDETGAAIEDETDHLIMITWGGVKWENALNAALEENGTTREDEWDRLLEAGVRELLAACIEEQEGGRSPQV